MLVRFCCIANKFLHLKYKQHYLFWNHHSVHSVICEGQHFTFMWKTFTWLYHTISPTGKICAHKTILTLHILFEVLVQSQKWLWWLRLWCLMPFQQYFSYIVAVSFIGGGNWSSRRKPPTCHKSPTNFITKCCIEYTSPEYDSNSQRQWW